MRDERRLAQQPGTADQTVKTQRKRLLHLPLVEDEGEVGLADAVVGAPGVLAVEQAFLVGGGDSRGGAGPLDAPRVAFRAAWIGRETGASAVLPRAAQSIPLE